MSHCRIINRDFLYPSKHLDKRCVPLGGKQKVITGSPAAIGLDQLKGWVRLLVLQLPRALTHVQQQIKLGQLKGAVTPAACSTQLLRTVTPTAGTAWWDVWQLWKHNSFWLGLIKKIRTGEVKSMPAYECKPSAQQDSDPRRTLLICFLSSQSIENEAFR